MKYIGIDIGDGETAITVVSESGSLIPSVVPLGNTASIRSIVGDLNGKSVIGDTVMLNHGVTNRSARFKSRFLYDPVAREDLRRFAEGLYELFRKSVHETDLKIALGCPADWANEVRERYAAIVSSAGFPRVYTVSESRAAFLYAHNSNEMNLSAEMLQRPTLVIDIGSSTLDYAYIVDGRERDVGIFGEKDLGGGILDQLILEDAIERSPNPHEIRKALHNNSWRSYCELLARNLKEEYFRSEEKYVTHPCSTIAPIYANPDKPLSLKISLRGDIMQKLLNQSVEQLRGRSFARALRDSLERAREITRENPVELMIITGGASRMAFFRQLCSEVFPDAVAALCPEPEFSIARGLGIASRTDDMLAEFRAKVAAFFESGAIEMEVEKQLPHLLPDYIPAVAKIMCDGAVLQATLDFEGKGAELEAYLRDKIGQAVADRVQTRVADKLVTEWIGTRLVRTQEKLDQLCDEYHIDRADMSLIRIHARVQIPEAKIPLILRIFSGGKQKGRLRKFAKRLAGIKIMSIGMRHRMVVQLTKASEDFAQELSCKLVEQLHKQIDEQTKKVEIQIS